MPTPGYGTVPGRHKDGNSEEKLHRVEEQVTEVTGLLHDALEKSLQRGEKLDHLEGRADSLSTEARHFQSHSRGLARDMWWKNKRWAILLAIVILLVLGGVGFVIYWEISGKHHH